MSILYILGGLALGLGGLSLSRKKSKGGKRPSGQTIVVQSWGSMFREKSLIKQELAFLKRAPKRSPFFARTNKSGLHIPRGNLDQRVLKQCRYVIESGADCIAFNGPTPNVNSGSFGLLEDFKTYMKLEATQNIKLNFILVLFAGRRARNKGVVKTDRRTTEKQIGYIVNLMKHPKWQTVLGGRPVFYVLEPQLYIDHMGLRPLIEHIRFQVKSAGLKDPYIVGQSIFQTGRFGRELKDAGFDALTDYSPTYGAGTVPVGQGLSYQGASTELIKANLRDTRHGIDLVPYGMFECWPIARAKDPTNFNHYKQFTKGQLTKRANAVTNFTKKKAKHCPSGLQNWYSVDEYSEFCALLPTMGAAPAFMPVKRVLNEVKKSWKK